MNRFWRLSSWITRLILLLPTALFAAIGVRYLANVAAVGERAVAGVAAAHVEHAVDHEAVDADVGRGGVAVEGRERARTTPVPARRSAGPPAARSRGRPGRDAHRR